LFLHNYQFINLIITNYYTFVFKEGDLFKDDIRKYLENDEAIDSIDYLIELKNNMCNNDVNSLHFIKTVINNIIMNYDSSLVFLKIIL